MKTTLEVTRRIAEREGTAVTGLPPLYETIDPDLLETFVESEPGPDASVTFAYCGYRVTVTGDGAVAVDSSREARAKWC